jgi:hypothetical protein
MVRVAVGYPDTVYKRSQNVVLKKHILSNKEKIATVNTLMPAVAIFQR